jgi:hypothetical protein
MKLIILFSLIFSTAAFADAKSKDSTAKIRLSKWKVKYCDNTLKRNIASECRIKAKK